jgi:hypothetical protein
LGDINMLSVNGLILMFGFGFMLGMIFDMLTKIITRYRRPDIYENLLDALYEWNDEVGAKELEDHEVGLNHERYEEIVKRLKERRL